MATNILKEIIEKYYSRLEGVEPGSDEAEKIIKQISELTKSLNEVEKNENSVKLEKERIEIEEKRLKVEEKRLKVEEKKIEKDEKNNKIDKRLQIGKIAFEGVKIGVIVFALSRSMGSMMAFETAGIVRSKGWKYVDDVARLMLK